MIKKAYQKPTMTVVKIQQQAHLLAGSVKELEGTPEGYYELE